MKSLERAIRDHVDGVAAPITSDEVRTRAPSAADLRPRRWPVVAAAAVLAVAGLAAVAFSLAERDDSARNPGPVATSPGDTSPTRPVGVFDVDVPPGLTVEQVGNLLAKTIETVNPEEFAQAADASVASSDFWSREVDSAEGLLAPGLYTISDTDSEAAIAEQMIARMNDLARASDIEAASVILGRDPYEIMVIASMIEREATVVGDQAGISRVIHNRLAITASNPDTPFPLEIDSAVLYGRDQLGGDPDTPFAEVSGIPSDWNTYLLPGLPRTPIASPSAAAIAAALHPAPNPGPGDPLCVDLPVPDECRLLFYVVSDEDGSMAFAATSEQHVANVELARELGLLATTTTPTSTPGETLQVAATAFLAEGSPREICTAAGVEASSTGFEFESVVVHDETTAVDGADVRWLVCSGGPESGWGVTALVSSDSINWRLGPLGLGLTNHAGDVVEARIDGATATIHYESLIRERSADATTSDGGATWTVVSTEPT